MNIKQMLIVTTLLFTATACGGGEAPTPPPPTTNFVPVSEATVPATQPAAPTQPTGATEQQPPPAEVVKLRPEVRGVEWGYVDMAGEWVIEPQFETANRFFDGLAAVTVEGQYGYIDPTGQFVIPPQFVAGQDFSEGVAAVLTNDEQWGYINQAGQFVIQPQYSYADSFSEGLAAVIVEGQYGFINLSGEFVIQPQFDWARRFVEGYAVIGQDGLNGFIDPTGQVIIEPQFEQADSFSEGLAMVVQGGLSGYVNPAGELVIAPQFEWADSFAEGLAHVSQAGQSGFINQTGQFVIPPQFETAWRFSEGLAPVNVEGQWGYVNQAGELVIAPQFEWADGFVDGLAFVQLDPTNTAFIDPTGQVVINVKPTEQLIIGETVGLTPEQVRFGYDVLAESMEGAIMAARPVSLGTGGDIGSPAHLRFTFDGEELPEWFWPRERQLLIYPTAGYQAIFDTIDNDYLGSRIGNLQQILADTPTTFTEEIPFLPPIPAAQVFQTQVAYLTFQGGSGVRFVTMYSQAIEPIHNELIFYTFQGLTTDGDYYVSFTYPVTALVLPDTSEAAQPVDFEAFAENYQSYLQETVQSLDQSTVDEFSPSLLALDAMVQSLAIGEGW